MQRIAVPDVPLGLPSDMLERRPDMVAADRRVAAAFHRVGEAKAARLDEMEAKAKIAEAAQRKTGGGGAFFSTAGGILKYGGTAMPGNQMVVIILADIMENVYYDAPYDPEVPASPKCFAFGKSEREMQPHEAVALEDCFEQQADTCSECPHNEWGSAAKGKGKACSNGMRLAMIPAGVYSAKGRGREVSFSLDKLFEDAAHFKSAETAFAKSSAWSTSSAPARPRPPPTRA